MTDSKVNLREVKDLFHQALKLEPVQRDDFLQRKCAGNIGLRIEVESLLISLTEAQDFLEMPVIGEISASEASWKFQEGQEVSHYTIVSPIGIGGMGEVYLAEDRNLKRNVALKIVPDDLAADLDRLRRFENEALVVSALNHPNIVTVYEFGSDNGINLLATEYVKGRTLRERLKAGVLSAREIVDIGIQTASALQAAHEAGVIHRDVKPENIMIRDDGYVKVLDFGLAKLMQPESAAPESQTRRLLSQPGIILGTAAYMSPEQTRSRPIDARSDLFSLGVVLYEMAAGLNPFKGETVTDVIAAIIQKDPPPTRRYNDRVPVELDLIISKLLRKERDERYQRAEELLADLHRLERGIHQNSDDTAPHARRRSSILDSKARRWLIIAILFALLLAAGIGWWYWSSKPTELRSIAVLPFVNESQNPELDYLSDGITETVLGKLSRLPELRVKARSTVFHYKGSSLGPAEIARELGVQAVLLGRVVSKNDELSLYLELVDSSSGDRLWDEQYHRRSSDLIALQNDIARDVSAKLSSRLTGDEEQALTKNYTADVGAYRMYLQGRYHSLKITRPDLRRAIGLYEQAIERDPNYAMAYAGLADAYRSLGLGGEMDPTEVFPKAREAANRAIELDDSLAEAHGALGNVYFRYDFDWGAAERQFRRALELNPESGDTHANYAHLLSAMARHDEALSEMERARELEPLNMRTRTLEGQFLIHAGKIDEALFHLRSSQELEPNFWLTYTFASAAYAEKGMFDEALDAANRGRALSPATHTAAMLGYALGRSGRTAHARAVLNEMLELSSKEFVPPYNIAFILIGIGDREEALEMLEKSVAVRDPRLVWLNVEPKWNNLRRDPKFRAIIRKLGLAADVSAALR